MTSLFRRTWDYIRFRRGAEASLPALREGEPAFTTDTYKLFIGSLAGNQQIAGGGGGGSITVADAAGDTTTWPVLAPSQTGSVAPKTAAGFTFDALANTLYVGFNGVNTAGLSLWDNINGTFLDITAGDNVVKIRADVEVLVLRPKNDDTYTLGTISNRWAGAFLSGSVLYNPTPLNDLSVSGETATLTAGENVAFGDVCYLKSDGKLWKADADAPATVPADAMAAATIAANNGGVFLLRGWARNDAWTWTPGSLVYLSKTAGVMTQTQPVSTDDAIQVLGKATHADRIYFSPERNYITHT